MLPKQQIFLYSVVRLDYYYIAKKAYIIKIDVI